MSFSLLRRAGTLRIAENKSAEKILKKFVDIFLRILYNSKERLIFSELYDSVFMKKGNI